MRALSSVRRHMIWDRSYGSGREALAHWWTRLCDLQLMLQAAIGDRLAFDPFAFE